MNAKSQARLSVSTWSLHRSLGKPPFYGPTSEKGQLANPTAEHAFSLLELPVQIAARGINTLPLNIIYSCAPRSMLSESNSGRC